MTFPRLLYPIVPARRRAAGAPPQHLFGWLAAEPSSSSAARGARPRPARGGDRRRADRTSSPASGAALAVLLGARRAASCCSLLRSRLGAVNGALLALAALPTLYPVARQRQRPPVLQPGAGVPLAPRDLPPLVLRRVAAALDRPDLHHQPRRPARRPPRPRGGRALLVGFGCGAGARRAPARPAGAGARPCPASGRRAAERRAPAASPLPQPGRRRHPARRRRGARPRAAVRLAAVRWAPAAAALVAAGCSCGRSPSRRPCRRGWPPTPLFGALLVWIGRRARPDRPADRRRLLAFAPPRRRLRLRATWTGCRAASPSSAGLVGRASPLLGLAGPVALGPAPRSSGWPRRPSSAASRRSGASGTRWSCWPRCSAACSRAPFPASRARSSRRARSSPTRPEATSTTC